MTPVRLESVDSAGLAGMVHFLDIAGLPASDLGAAGQRLYAFHHDGPLGYGGLEGDGFDLLLRSLVVFPDRRGMGLGRVFVKLLERRALEAGAGRLHLLTTRAAPFFRAIGYSDATRDTAPPSIAGSLEFMSLCPTHAAYLTKQLEVTA